MSTWHQDQARKREQEVGETLDFSHAELWTVVDNPMNGTMTMARYRLPEDAQREAERLNRLTGPLRYVRAWVLPPKSHYRNTGSTP